MRWTDLEARGDLERQIAALASAILEGRERIVPNAFRMHGLLSQLGLSNDDPEAREFAGIVSETDHLPTENERRYWNPASLTAKDVEIEAAEASARQLALPACENLLQRFGRRDPA